MELESPVIVKKVKKLMTRVLKAMMGDQLVRRIVIPIDGLSLKGVCLAWGKEMQHVSKGRH